MYRTTTTSSMMSRFAWLILIAIVVFGAAELVGYLVSFVDPSRYDEIWYLAWL